MATKFKNTYVDFELEDGRTVKLTLAYALILKHKNSNADAYKEYNRVMTKGVQDEFDNLRLLHMAYLCAENEGEDMTFEEFIEVVSPDREYVATAVAKLIAPKKMQASAGRLS